MCVKLEFCCVLLALILMGPGAHPAPKDKIVTKDDFQERVLDFNADEHDLIGSSAVLPNGPNNLTLSKLTLPNGVQVQFGKIVALAGDFYGVPDKPIINTAAKVKTETERRQEQKNRRKRFLAAYRTFDSQKEVNKLVKMIEEDHVARNSNKTLHSNAEWDEATGGFWVGGFPWVNGRMLNLAIQNFDHFQPQAVEAYLVGHQLAIEKAREAAGETSPKNKTRKLMEAFSIDAFACHFLTDSFSAGHIRTPRVELHNKVTPSKVGDYLSKFMHDEDCEYGVRVKNKKGDKWIAYGDAYLLSKGNKDNYKLAKEAVQASVAQVGKAYDNTTAKIDPKPITDLIPFVDPDAVNNKPLFKVRNGALLRRDNVTNLQDPNVEANWWGVTTVTQLRGAKKTNSGLPAPAYII